MNTGTQLSSGNADRGSTSAAAPSEQTHGDLPWTQNPANPCNWSKRRKWTVTWTTTFISFIIGCNSTAISVVGSKILDDMGVPDNNLNSIWPITAWTMAAALGPMVGMPLLETFGTRKGYLITYFIFTILVIPQAVATNFTTLIVSRALAGAFGGILQNGPEPFIADMFQTDEQRSVPITVFVLAYEAGVTLGPAWGSIFNGVSWRWVFYSQLIVYGACFPCLWVVIKETRAPVILAAKAQMGNSDRPEAVVVDTDKPSLRELFYTTIIRPTVLLFTEPVIFFLAMWSAFCFGLVFISLQSIELVYSLYYGFNAAQVGLVQVAFLIGEMLGFLACIPQNAYYRNSARSNTQNPGEPRSEARLMLSIPASFLGLSGGLFWYAWAGQPFIHWALPTAGLILVGFGIMTIVTSAIMYLTDAYTAVAGSAVAAVSLGENLFASWLPLSTQRMYTKLGFQWASSLLGFVALVLSFAPVVLTLKGRQLRAKGNRRVSTVST